MYFRPFPPGHKYLKVHAGGGIYLETIQSAKHLGGRSPMILNINWVQLSSERKDLKFINHCAHAISAMILAITTSRDIEKTSIAL